MGVVGLILPLGRANGNRVLFCYLPSVCFINPDFRLEDYSACHLLACWLLAELISSTLKMEGICSSETSVETQRNTQRHIPEYDTLQMSSVFNIILGTAILVGVLRRKQTRVWFEVLTEEVLKSYIFCDITTCSPIKVNRHFTWLHLQGWKVCQAKYQHEAGIKQRLLHSGVFLRLLFYPDDAGHIFLRNIGWISPDYTALYPRR
jgi:hypothetical protein